MVQLGLDDRAGAHQAHLALQHVQKLRQFVQAELAQDCPQGRDAGVVDQLALFFPDCGIGRILLQVAFQHGVAIDDHGAELPAAKLAPPEADAAVPVKHGARVRQLEKNDQPQDQRPEQQEAQQDKPEVERPLSPASDRGGRRRGGRSGKARQQGSLAVASNKILDTEHLHEPALQRTTEQLTAAAAKGEKALGNHLDHVWHNHLAKVLSILDDG